MRANKYSLMMIALLGAVWLAEAKEPPTGKGKLRSSAMKVMAGDCTPPTAETDLNINNVRARILAAGDMWWDLDVARYEVPKGSGKHSMFAGSLWLGGYDEANQLKMAAMTYRQDGVDYWTGPLADDATVTAEVCNDYDKHWLVYKDEVAIHKAWIDCKMDPDCNDGDKFPGYSGRVPQSIIDWPGNGLDGDKLAPYFELDTNGIPGFYEWQYDYPGYDFDRQYDCQKKEVDLLYGDQTIWWVYNDKGNTHEETQAGALGFEIRAQAFAFTSNDEVNNMTFNNYRILNRSTFRLRDTYFGTWFDPDLGNHEDDIIGCDIARGLGYCYNGKAEDSGPRGYGLNPPAVGFDFFQGPFADYFDGLDNDRDGCVDGVKRNGICVPENPAEGINERIIMSGFMYYNNSGSSGVPSQTTDPQVAQEFYNYLTINWKNGNPLVIENPSGAGNINNGDGFTPDGSGERTFFAYPGLSYDTTGAYEPSAELPNGGWWESPNNQADKRGLHTAGPFSLAPGALNFITTGVVWARNFSSQDLFASVNDVIIADDKAQQLFDNCFQILDGPRSPEVEVIGLDRRIILKFTNAFDPDIMGYDQIDPAIPVPEGWTQAQINAALDTGYFSYRFEGFQIFQVNGPNVSVDNIYDTEQSRLVAQSDIKNGVTQLVNFNVDPDLENGALVPMDMTLEANNEGIKLTYEFTEDAFAEGDRRLVNHKEYYYYVIAYSQNQYKKTDPRNLGASSQKEPYLAGRNIGNGQKPYLAIPSKVQIGNGGTIINGDYGDQIQITRYDGAGNGGNFLRITEESENAIVFNYINYEIQYQEGSGPFILKVVDPLQVMGGQYSLEFSDASPQANWWIINNATNDTIARSAYNISFLGEQIIDELGISVTFINEDRPGNDTEADNMNGVIGGEIVYDDPSMAWLTGVEDTDGETPQNWILAGTQDASATDPGPYADYPGDPKGFFETILNGTWAPAAYGSTVEYVPGVTPGYSVRRGPYNFMYNIGDIGNVDVVITRDQDKWTRVPVLEAGNVAENNEGGKATFTLRAGTTMDKDGNGGLVPNPNAVEPYGWSYFPGYAINVETGRRLNMAFAEASWLKSENGDDMLWNPSDNIFRTFDYALGGMHLVYVFADSARGTFDDLTYRGDNIQDNPLYNQIKALDNGTGARNVFGNMYWIGFPLAQPGMSFNTYAEIPTETKVSLRMDKPYQSTNMPSLGQAHPNDGIPLYMFNTDAYATETGVNYVGNEALDLIRVVPNPYNGSSLYEDSQLDNIVKITNLPRTCKISIFMTNGTLVRTINKDNSLTYSEWDLKNDFNVPIASGIYLIHIDAGEIGQKVIKWMGTLRPVDLNAF